VNVNGSQGLRALEDEGVEKVGARLRLAGDRRWKTQLLHAGLGRFAVGDRGN